jgi:ribosomal protein S18 acetylase RimI-like enzyme
MFERNKNIEIKFVKTWPSEEIVELYKAGGWWRDSYDPSGIKSLIDGSFAFAVAFDPKKGKAIGMGRVISDGVSDAYIQDMVVLPEYRKSGIGKKLVNFLLKHCLSKGLTWIGLIAEPNQDKFYSPLGFKTMKDHVPMKYQMEE